MNTTIAVEAWSEDAVACLTAGPDAMNEASLSPDELSPVLQTSRQRAVIRHRHGCEDPVWRRDSDVLS